MGRRQKGKHHKRSKAWHRRRGQAHRWLSAIRRLDKAAKAGEGA